MTQVETEDEVAWQRAILRMEADGKVTGTFRRLDRERQRAVIEAIFAEATEHGAHAVQVKRVATRAGVAVGSLYQYFPRREGMLEFAVEATAGFLTASLDGSAAAMADLPLREGLEIYLGAGLDSSVANADLLTFFVRAAYAGEAGYAETMVRPVARSMKAMVSALLTGARARGELRAGLDVETATRLVLALTTVVDDAELVPRLNDYYLLYDGERTPRQIRRAAVDFIVRAIGREATHDDLAQLSDRLPGAL